jgi:hypothetical protein
MREWHLLKVSYRGGLIVNSHTEALALANGAAAFITAHGGSDAPFTTYFGTVQDTTSQFQVFFVCPACPDSKRFSHSTPIQEAVNEHNNITFHCTDSDQRCATTTVDGFPAYVLGNDILCVPIIPPYNSANLISPIVQFLSQLLQRGRYWVTLHSEDRRPRRHPRCNGADRTHTGHRCNWPQSKCTRLQLCPESGFNRPRGGTQQCRKLQRAYYITRSNW